MANNIKYAQNLIGDWNKDIYEPKKQVLQDIYQTNWDKLSNDYNTLKDTLARNYDNARLAYTNTLNDIQDQSFNRMNNATIDLANRGLSSSGVTNLVNQADTQIKGEEVNKALSSLLSTGADTQKGLYGGLESLGKGQNSLYTDLLGDIGNLTDADAANMQQYAGLVGNIAENAASRAASSALSRLQRTEEDDTEELKRRMLISDILDADDMSDDDKVKNLVLYGGVDGQQARNVISAYNYNIANDKFNKALSAYGNASSFVQKEKDIANAINKYVPGIIGTTAKVITSDYNPLNIANAIKNSNAKAVQTQRDNLSKYTYGDIYDILYGNR